MKNLVKNTPLQRQHRILIILIGVFIAIFLINFSSASTWTSGLNANLSAYYSFDLGVTLTDLIGSNNLATIGTPTSTGIGCLLGNCWTGFSSLDYIQNSTPSAWNLNNNEYFTINTWVKFNSVSSGQSFLGTMGTGTSWSLLLENDGGGYTMLFADGANRLWATHEESAGSWYMVTIIHNSSGMFMYENGVFKGTRAGGTTNTNSIFQIGNASFEGPLNGYVDETSLWTNRSLTEAEMAQLYNGGAGITYTVTSISVNLVSPANNTQTINSYSNFSASFNSIGLNLTNATLYVWNINGNLFGTNYTTISGASNSSALSISNFSIGTYHWNYFACGTNSTSSLCSFNSPNYTFFVLPYTEGAAVFNSSAYESTTQSFYDSINTTRTLSNVNFTYNGITYINTNYSCSQSFGNCSFSNNVGIPLLSSSQNNSFYWSFQVNGVSYNTISYGQYVNQISFGICNSTLTIKYLNLTFFDETNSSQVFGQIPTSTFYYWTSNPALNRSFIYENLTGNQELDFCSNPTSLNFGINEYMQYQGSGYPQRIINTNFNVNSSAITKQNLYLLLQANGQYVTFQVINVAKQAIMGVSVSGTRTISGNTIQIANGVTDSAGAVTFWVSPYFQQIFTFSYIGYTTYVFNTIPTQTSYTIVFSQSAASTVDYRAGISTTINPQNNFLWNQTTYNFNFTLSSSYWNVNSFGYYLYGNNGTQLDYQTASTNGGFLSSNDNTQNYTSISMIYFYYVNGTEINNTQFWIVQPTTYGSQFSIANFFADLTTYTNLGMFGLDDFGKALIAVVILVMLAGALVYRFGLVSEPAIMGVIFGVVLLLDSQSWIPNPNFIGIVPVKGFVTIITAILMISMIIREEMR